MRDYKQEVAKLIAPKLDKSAHDIMSWLESPPREDMGDLAFPCFRLAKEMRKAPPQIAQDLADSLKDELPDWIQAVKATGPYLNIYYVASELARDVLSEVLKNSATYGAGREGEGKTVLVEYSSPNIAKPFHVGHAFSTLLGQVIANLYETLGYKVVRLNHLGDYGTQFGKLIAAWKLWGNEAALAENAIEELTRVYVKFHQEVENNPELEVAGREYFRKLEAGEPEEVTLWQRFRDVSLKEFDRLYKRLNVHFDNFNGESFYSDKIPAVVAMLKEKNLLVESEGAQVVDLEEYKLNPCLILKSDGTTIYASRDIAAVYYRDAKWHFYKNIYVVGLPQKNHFQQVFAVLDKAGFPQSDRNVHVAFGTVKFADGEMSTRQGNIIKLEDLLDQSVAKTREIIVENNPGMSEKDIDKTAEAVGLAAVEYTYLRNGRERDILFDWSEILDFEGDTAPYLLYTISRAASILRKENIGIDNLSEQEISQSLVKLDGSEEKNIVNMIASIPHSIRHAAEHYEPSILLREVARMARAFNSYYHNHPILKNDDIDVTKARLLLTKAVHAVMCRCLQLSAIPIVERM